MRCWSPTLCLVPSLCCVLLQPRVPLLLLLSQPSPFRLHAELSFLSWFHDTELSFDENYKVTWYMSWSPCPECAKEIVTFLDNHHNVTLTIYVARLYYHWNPTYKEGLRALVQGGTRLYTMAFPGERWGAGTAEMEGRGAGVGELWALMFSSLSHCRI